MNLCCDVLRELKGKTLVTAESCTGGGIGAALTNVPGMSSVFKGGIVSYCNELKTKLLGVDTDLLETYGAVSAPVAEAMAAGAMKKLDADIAVSVTGLAGPDGDEFGNPVGTVYIGYCDKYLWISEKHLFSGDRDEVRRQATEAALMLVLKRNNAEKIC